MNKMKDSGVEWIGEMPECWTTKKFKHYFSIIGGNGFKEEFQGQKNGDIPFCKASDINGTNKYVDSAKNYVTEELAKQEKYNIIQPNSILISKIGEALKKNHRKINTIPCIVDNNCEGFSSKGNDDINYLYYVLCAIDMIWFDNGGTIPSINNEKLKNFFLPDPCIEEQQKISARLDQKCSQIDALIINQQTQIEKLKAYKQSVITEVVTKGLDPTVPMKDSGVEWIGEIPEHWSLNRLKYYASYNDEVLKENTTPTLHIKYIEIGSVALEKGITHIDHYEFKDAPSRARRITRIGDVIVSTVRTYLKAIASIKDEGLIVSTGFCVIRPHDILNKKYLEYFCKSDSFSACVTSNSQGISYPAINASKLMSFNIPRPPHNTQEQIATYLDRKCSIIDRLINLKQSKIEKLNQYKKSLIYEYVTGKKEVSHG